MSERQTILVTGATGNVGGGAALALARRGAGIVLLGRDRETLEAKVSAVRAAVPGSPTAAKGDGTATLVVDFSDMESVREAAAEALDRFPAIDGLVLSVAVLVQDGPNILRSGHEVMFATNVMGPFLFTQLLLERMRHSRGLILHVVAPFYEELDWTDLESITNHKTTRAYNRTKTCGRAIAGELARRYAGTLSSVAFNPTFIIDKSDPELRKRWPSGFMGLFWSAMAMLLARPPGVAGEPIADLFLSNGNRDAINGALFKLDKQLERPDKAMQDMELATRLWDELVWRTGL